MTVARDADRVRSAGTSHAPARAGVPPQQVDTVDRAVPTGERMEQE